jgi:hypothetical protein
MMYTFLPQFLFVYFFSAGKKIHKVELRNMRLYLNRVWSQTVRDKLLVISEGTYRMQTPRCKINNFPQIRADYAN